MNNKKTKEKYNEISEIDYLLKYLFLNEENYIIFNNRIVNLKITMDHKCNLKSKIVDDPYDNETIFQIRIPVLFEIIKQLKETKTNNFAFSNEWERIVAFVKLNTDLTE